MKKRNCKIGTAVDLKSRGEKGVITQINTLEKGWCLVNFGEGAVYHCNHKRLRLSDRQKHPDSIRDPARHKAHYSCINKSPK